MTRHATASIGFGYLLMALSPYDKDREEYSTRITGDSTLRLSDPGFDFCMAILTNKGAFFCFFHDAFPRIGESFNT